MKSSESKISTTSPHLQLVAEERLPFFGSAAGGQAIQRKPFFDAPLIQAKPIIQRKAEGEHSVFRSESPSSAAGGQFSLEMFRRLEQARRFYNLMESPLQKAVGMPEKKHVQDKNLENNEWRWNPDIVSGLMLMYNKMTDDGTWQYVDKVVAASSRVTMSFVPKGGHDHLRKKLEQHDYTRVLARFGGIHWGMRKYALGGTNVHFKHHRAEDISVEAHIDLYDPTYSLMDALMHGIVDYRGWKRRNPRQIYKFLKKEGLPMSEGILKHLESAKGQQKKEPLMPLPDAMKAIISKIDKNLLRNWMLSQALNEKDMAGPDEEERMLEGYNLIKKNQASLTDAQELAQAIARELTIAAKDNERNGEAIIDHVEISLGETPIWGYLRVLTGLEKRLEWIVNILVSHLPKKDFMVKHIKFTYGKKEGGRYAMKEIWTYIRK